MRVKFAYWIEPITLGMDLIGLTLISWFLFSIPEPVRFVYDSPYGIPDNYDFVSDAINAISRNMSLIKKGRWGFVILLISILLKLTKWMICNWKYRADTVRKGA